jgi:hypothetical protein
MIRRVLWCSGMLAIVLHSASAEEMKVHPQRKSIQSAPLRPILYDASPTPQYLILRQTAGGMAQPTVGRPYAYGWFGAAPRRHTITHQGYYGSHWLWPGRIAP